MDHGLQNNHDNQKPTQWTVSRFDHLFSTGHSRSWACPRCKSGRRPCRCHYCAWWLWQPGPPACVLSTSSAQVCCQGSWKRQRETNHSPKTKLQHVNISRPHEIWHIRKKTWLMSSVTALYCTALTSVLYLIFVRFAPLYKKWNASINKMYLFLHVLRDITYCFSSNISSLSNHGHIM